MGRLITFLNVYDKGRIREGAVDFLYQLLGARPAAANISHREMPTLDQHRAFVTRRPYWQWLILTVEPQAPREGLAGPVVFEPVWVGALSVTNQNEIGISILPTYQRKGYAREAIRKLLAELVPLPAVASQRVGRFLANVSPENEASHALFEGLGAKLKQLTYEF